MPVKRMRLPSHGLQSRGAIRVRYGRNDGTLRLTHGKSKGHERRRVGAFKIFAGGFLEYGGRKGTKRFAMLNAIVQYFLHLRAARIGKDAAIAQSARPPFRPALKPSHN